MLILLFALLVFVYFLWRRVQQAELASASLRARLDGLEKRFEWHRERTAAPEAAPPVPVSRETLQRPPAPAAQPVVVPEPVVTVPVSAPDVSSPVPIASSTPMGPIRPAEGLETRIGARWLLYVGIVAVVLGVAYFEKLAIQNHWINETARVIQGGVVGVLLVAAGLRLRKRYGLYGEILAGGGAAIEYVSIFAAYNFYHLIDRTPAFALLLGVTAVAAVLADRHRSQGLALIGVGGGFVTPFLLPGRTDAQVALFGYETILIAGTMYLAARRSWAWLNVVSYILTVFTVGAWAVRFYAHDKYLVTELFLTAFCAMFVYILRTMRKSESVIDALVKAILWSAPALYYMASIAILTTHPVAMLPFVLAVALTCAFFGTDAREDVSAVARLGGWLLTYFPLMLWTSRYAGQSWSKAGLATLVAVYLIQLIVQLQTTGKTRLLRWPDVAALHLNGLGTFGVADAMVMYDVRLVTIGWIAAGFALWQAAIAFRLFTDRRGHALHYVALGGTLATIAIGLIFRGPWVTMGWAVEGAAVIWLGLRERRDWLRVGGVLLFAVAVARLLDLLFTRTGGGLTPVFNTVAACAALVIALTYWIARLHRGMAGHATAIVAAQLLTLAVVSSEINRYWAGLVQGDDPYANHFGREVSLSIAWALYSTGLIIAGLRQRYAPLRYVAIAVFAVTSVKVFFNDLAELDQIYRVLSIIGLGVTLLVTSYLYHRFSARIAEEDPQSSL